MPKKAKSKKKTSRNVGNDKKHIRIGAKTANGDIDIKQHTIVNITPTENPKYSISQYYKHPGCTSQLKKAGLTNFNNFYNFMFNAYKIFLYCCDDSFEGERPSAEKLENGLYQYPQQRIAHEIIDAKLFWLKILPYHEIKIFYNSNGLKFENGTYIEEDEILNAMK